MSLTTDLRYAFRRLFDASAYSLTVVLMLSLGIAISVLMFATLQGVLGSLPYPQSEQLVSLQSDNPERGVNGGMLTPAEALRLEQGDGPFASFGYYGWGGMTVTEGDRPREFSVARVSRGFFPTLASQPLIGRWFQDAEFERGATSLILSHREWMRVFNGSEAAVGSTLDTTSGQYTVVGVMPADFSFPSTVVGAWLTSADGSYPSDQPWVWNARFMSSVARLDPALTDFAVSDRLRTIAAELAERYQLGEPLTALSTQSLLERSVGSVRNVLWGSFALAALVLLIACANVAILVDARQLARRHQQAVTMALGASRARLFRGALLEVALLASVSVALGIALALIGIDQLRELARGSLPRVDAIAIDGSVLLYAAALGLLVPMFAALVGALRPRGEEVEAMRGGGRGVVGSSRRGRWLPALGVALSTVSLVAGSALLFSLWKLQSVDPGFRHQQIYALQLYHNADAEAMRSFTERLRERLGQLPGTTAVAATSAAPLAFLGDMSIDMKLPERDQPEPFQAKLRRVTPNFLELLELPLVLGRGIEDTDTAGSEKVAVINQTLARRLFADRDPLNQLLELPLGERDRVSYRVVGVVRDSLNVGLRQAAEPEVLVSLAASPPISMTFLVASERPMPGYEKLFTDALFEVEPSEAVTRVYPLSEDVDAQLTSARFFARTVGAAALAALLLAAFGVYAVAALRQQQRVAELGLRVAIGAPASKLAGQSLIESGRAVLVGVVAGLGGAWAALALLRAQLFGVEGSEPGVLLLGLSTLLLATLLAALPPALRAARVDPMVALRQDG